MKTSLISSQFLRYAIVGTATNCTGYFIYLGLTWSGMGHKLTMTLLYVIGIALSFLLNRNWSFGQYEKEPGTLWRFLIAYGAGYILNFSMLLTFVDYFHLPHQFVQAATIVILVVMFFLLQRYWIFRPIIRSL